MNLERLRAEHLRITCHTEEPALLVIAESHHPGWRAWVDGVETPVAVVNHLFRGVPLGSGEHVVELRFAPRSYALGWRLSAAVRLLLLLAAWELRR